ncbi:MAG: putative sugar nucleotidyl transferase [Bacteroidota bacterium]
MFFPGSQIEHLMHLLLFEDARASDLLPLTYFRPTFDLRLGAFTFRERAVRLLKPSGVSVRVRAEMVPLLEEELPRSTSAAIPDGLCVVLRGSLLLTPALAKTLREGRGEFVITRGGEIVAARLSGGRLKGRGSAFPLDDELIRGVPVKKADLRVMRHPWELVHANPACIESDMAIMGKGKVPRGAVHPKAVILGRRGVRIGKGAVIDPFAVLDARGGPILVGEGARIQPHVYVEGPCVIGENSVIKSGARIVGGSTIGPSCRVGGEVGHSIFHSYVNKQHDGFVGHSYLSPWVNLGAGTTTSNLKNTYGSIRVRRGGEQVDTGVMFAGLFTGDHVKTGINMSLDTGTIMGPVANLYGPGLPPKEVPAFSWGEPASIGEYDPEKALLVASRAMSRRGVKVSPAYEALFRRVFIQTSHDRSPSSR